MSIKIEINVPDEAIDGTHGPLARHLATLGYAPTYRVIGVDRGSSDGDAMVYGRAEDGKVHVDKIVTNTARAGESDEQTEARTKRGRSKKADDKPAISTNPEDRRPPEDDEATQAQDAADEQAEVEAAREPEKPLTVEDVKAAVGEYVTKFGMAETQQDGVKIFADALGKPPAGEAFWKMSLLASATQEQLQKAIVAWKTAAAAQTRYVAKE